MLRRMFTVANSVDLSCLYHVMSHSPIGRDMGVETSTPYS